MEQNFKPITKQLAIAAFILTLVTVLSFGIRQVRLSAHRADTGESTPSARSSDPENQPQPEQPINANGEARGAERATKDWPKGQSLNAQ